MNLIPEWGGWDDERSRREAHQRLPTEEQRSEHRRETNLRRADALSVEAVTQGETQSDGKHGSRCNGKARVVKVCNFCVHNLEDRTDAVTCLMFRRQSRDVLVLASKAYRGRRGTALTIHNSGSDCFTSHTGRFIPSKETRYTSNGELSGPQKLYEHFEKDKNPLSLPGFEPQFVQPAAQTLPRRRRFRGLYVNGLLCRHLPRLLSQFRNKRILKSFYPVAFPRFHNFNHTFPY